MKAKPAPAPKTVDDYMSRVPPKFRTLLQSLRRTIKAAAPEAVEIISYGMPAFRQKRILFYYSAFRDHCSLFIASAQVRRRFSVELKPFAVGKGTFRFTDDHPLPADLVIRMTKARVAENMAVTPSRRGRT